MKVGSTVLGASALVVAIGCTTFAQRGAADYERGEVSPTRFAQDSGACAKQSEVDQAKFGVGGDMDLTHSTYNRMYDQCMRASGYKRKPEKE
jgi:hypothetical protein